MGLILNQGIGDTIRVSLTGDPTEEIKSAKTHLTDTGTEQREASKWFPVRPVAEQGSISSVWQIRLKIWWQNIPLDLKVAVMGCVVNGPGEAREADIGIAGGVGEGLIIKHGEIYKKVPEAELLPALREELLHWEHGKREMKTGESKWQNRFLRYFRR